MHAQSCPTLCDPMDCSPPGSSLGKNTGANSYLLLQETINKAILNVFSCSKQNTKIFRKWAWFSSCFIFHFSYSGIRIQYAYPLTIIYHSKQVKISFSVFLYHPQIFWPEWWLDSCSRRWLRAGSPVITRTKLPNYRGPQCLQSNLTFI